MNKILYMYCDMGILEMYILFSVNLVSFDLMNVLLLSFARKHKYISLHRAFVKILLLNI